MATDWTLWDTVQEWFWDTLLDKVILEQIWGRAGVTELAAWALIIYSHIKGHPQLLLLGYGGAAGVVLMVMAAPLQRRFASRLRKREMAARETADPKVPAPQAASAPHEEIQFDYFPVSPLDGHGWKIGYFDERVRNGGQAAKDAYLKTREWKKASNAPSEDCVIIDVDACAIDYRIPTRSKLSTRLVCDFNFIQDAMLFALVGLITGDGSKTSEGYIKFDLGREPSQYVERYNEWVLPTDFPPLSNGWHHIDISLTDALRRTWGQAGWILRDLRAVRVRGHLGISPIKLY
jgi:hypothetical protein